jgi:hypothetical protein
MEMGDPSWVSRKDPLGREKTAWPTHQASSSFKEGLKIGLQDSGFRVQRTRGWEWGAMDLIALCFEKSQKC